MRVNGAELALASRPPIEYPSVLAVKLPLAFAERKARMALTVYSSGVFTFCSDPPWLRNKSELKIAFNTGRSCPLGLLLHQATMHWRTNSASGDRLGSV